MVDDIIPDDVKQFILEHIDSIAQFEALLLLRGSPQVDWTANAIAKRLYIGEQEARVILQRLCADGFLIASPEKSLVYRYHVGSPELGQTVDRVRPVADLSTWRLAVALLAMLVLLYGLIWDAD